MAKQQNVYRAHGEDGRPERSLRDVMTALIEEAHAQQRHGAAQKLQSAMSAMDQDRRFSQSADSFLPDALQPLLHEASSRRHIRDLVLGAEIRDEVRDFTQEVAQTALLRSHSLEPRHTVLLVGPPGTGKTSLASAIADEVGVPFFIVRYDGLVGSYLGETASRLQTIVDYVSRIPCVLFFDEFESIAKERGDAQETGEIKRVVSSLLLHMDALPTSCIVICATNHPELLDRAVWRRFEVRLELPIPGRKELREYFLRTTRAFGDLGISAQEFVEIFDGESFSEVEETVLEARRRLILNKGSISTATAFREAIRKWERRRLVEGNRDRGTGAVRKDKSRAKKGKADTGAAKAAISQDDLLLGSAQATRRDV